MKVIFTEFAAKEFKEAQSYYNINLKLLII